FALLPDPFAAASSRYSARKNTLPLGKESVIAPAAGGVRVRVLRADSPSHSEPKSSWAGEYWGMARTGADATARFVLGGVGGGDGTLRGVMAGGAGWGEGPPGGARGVALSWRGACRAGKRQ